MFPTIQSRSGRFKWFIPLWTAAALGFSTLGAAAVRTKAALETKEAGPYSPSTPKYVFARSLAEQEAQLKTNPLILRFAKSRQTLGSDPFRPAYHFVSPESQMNDPFGISFWQGRWHLFYQASPVGEPTMENFLGHAVSEDLIHWRDLPYALYPGIEAHISTGNMLVEKDRVIAFYPGVKSGQLVAQSRDPLLLNWEKTGPLITGEAYADYGDSDIWKEGDIYVGLIGSTYRYYPQSTAPLENRGAFTAWRGDRVWPKFALWTSKDLKTWQQAGELLFEHTPFTDRYDDGSVPNFNRIGDKYILLFFSHINGAQYLLGDYDSNKRKFRPYDHGRFNHGQVRPGGVHAPSAVEDGTGGVINILNINDANRPGGWDQLMSLPQRLTLGEDQRLRIAPVDTVATLRGRQHSAEETRLPADQEIVLKKIQGNAMELDVEIDPQQSNWVQLNVLRSPDSEEQTSITFFGLQTPLGLYMDGFISEEIVIDGSRSSRLPDVRVRPPERTRVNRNGENLRLRVFIDRSVVEVFVNDRQYLAMRVYPGRKDSLGISLRAHGSDAVLKRLDAWQMKPIWPVAAAKPEH